MHSCLNVPEGHFIAEHPRVICVLVDIDQPHLVRTTAPSSHPFTPRAAMPRRHRTWAHHRRVPLDPPRPRRLSFPSSFSDPYRDAYCGGGSSVPALEPASYCGGSPSPLACPESTAASMRRRSAMSCCAASPSLVDEVTGPEFKMSSDDDVWGVSTAMTLRLSSCSCNDTANPPFGPRL